MIVKNIYVPEKEEDCRAIKNSPGCRHCVYNNTRGCLGDNGGIENDEKMEKIKRIIIGETKALLKI
ncbi:MAG: hypothetical protein PHI66_04400 [Candidatus Pacebacteria bacterium]|nr:hypothetical protein [Candidatus Paceibacterota bacterium]